MALRGVVCVLHVVCCLGRRVIELFGALCQQIEVTFEIACFGILCVGAQDKGTGKPEKITLTNDWELSCLLMRTRVTKERVTPTWMAGVQTFGLVSL